MVLIALLAAWGCDGDSMGELDSGGGTDGGGSMDGGGADGGGGGMTTDAGPAGVACGTMTCSGTTPQCCVPRDPGGMATCISADAVCMGVAASCDGPEDCTAPQQCCVGFGSTGGGASCQNACGLGSRAACHAASDCPSVDGLMRMCCPFTGGGFSGSVCLPMCITGTP
jgi:hypothetical protein